MWDCSACRYKRGADRAAFYNPPLWRVFGIVYVMREGFRDDRANFIVIALINRITLSHCPIAGALTTPIIEEALALCAVGWLVKLDFFFAHSRTTRAGPIIVGLALTYLRSTSIASSAE